MSTYKPSGRPPLHTHTLTNTHARTHARTHTGSHTAHRALRLPIHPDGARGQTVGLNAVLSARVCLQLNLKSASARGALRVSAGLDNRSAVSRGNHSGIGRPAAQVHRVSGSGVRRGGELQRCRGLVVKGLV